MNAQRPTRIHEFISRAREVNAILERNGAEQLAKARACLLADLEELLVTDAGRTYSVQEAASLSDTSEETVRRTVRSGDIEDTRPNARGRMRIPADQIEVLKGKSRKRVAIRQGDPTSSAVAALARL